MARVTSRASNGTTLPAPVAPPILPGLVPAPEPVIGHDPVALLEWCRTMGARVVWFRRESTREARCRVRVDDFEFEGADLAEAAELVQARIDRYQARRRKTR